MRNAGSRRSRLVALTIVLALAPAACGKIVTLEGRPSPTRTPVPPPRTTVTTAPSLPPTPTVDFGPAVTAAAHAVSNGEFSLAVYDQSQASMIAQYHPDQRYYTESVVKLLIGLDSLDRGGSVATVTEMLSRSDDQVATRLWDADGGTAIVTRMAAKIGLDDTTPPTTGEWGDTRTTANDLVHVYQYLLDSAPESERTDVLTALHQATRVAADGTDQYFGIPDAVGGSQPWGVKQGWACCEPGWVLNTTGLVGPDNRFIVIALTSHDNGGGADVREEDSEQLTNAIKALLPDLEKLER